MTTGSVVKEKVTVCDEPFRDAVRWAVWLVVKVPDKTVKLAVAELPASPTKGAGTTRAALSLDKEIVTTPLGLATVTVQLEDCFAAVNDVGEQESELTVG